MSQIQNTDNRTTSGTEEVEPAVVDDEKIQPLQRKIQTKVSRPKKSVFGGAEPESAAAVILSIDASSSFKDIPMTF